MTNTEQETCNYPDFETERSPEAEHPPYHAQLQTHVTFIGLRFQDSGLPIRPCLPHGTGAPAGAQ